VHRGKSKVEPATNTVTIAAFEVYLASAAISQAFLIRILYSASIWNESNA